MDQPVSFWRFDATVIYTADFKRCKMQADKNYNAREPFSLNRAESNRARLEFVVSEVCVIYNAVAMV